MRRAWLTLLVAGFVLTSSGGWRREVQGGGLSPAPGLRVERTTEATVGKWQHVCGYLYNDTPSVPREVRLLVEARDSSGRVVDSRVAPVLGYIAPWGRTYFCSVAPAGATGYSVSVLAAEWTSDR